MSADPLGWFVEDWVARAGRVTVRRWSSSRVAGRPGNRCGADTPGRVRAPGECPEEPCCARFIGPADVVQLFRAVLCTVRRRMERENGWLPSPRDALGVMLDHAFSCWGALDGKLAARHKAFARDGWRCAVRTARVHVDAELARSPHPLPLRGGRRHPREPDHDLRVPPPAGTARWASTMRGTGARRAEVGDGNPPRRDAPPCLPLGGPPGAGALTWIRAG